MDLAGSNQRLFPITPDPSPPTENDEITTPCALCHRRCRLKSHRAWVLARAREPPRPAAADATKQSLDKTRAKHLEDLYQQNPGHDLAYTKSYAFTRALPSSVPHGVNSGRLDGFHELPIPGGQRPELHQAVYNLLNSKIGSATAFPLPTGLAVNDIGGSMIIPVMTNSTLCLSVIAAWKGVQVLTNHAPDYQYLYYEAQALQSLRKRLLSQGRGALTDEAIMASTLLWATATMFAQPEALRRHATGVRSIVTARGGLHKLGCGNAIQQLILWADFLTAQFLAEDVLFKEVDAEPLRIPPSLLRVHESFKIPEAFATVLRPETLDAVKVLRLLLVCHDKATRTGRVSVAEYKALMQLLNQSTIKRIHLEFKLKDSKGIDECVVLAMNMMRLTALFYAGHLFGIVTRVIVRLREAIDLQAGQFRWFQCLDLCIWASFVGLVNDFKTPERSRFADLLARLLMIKYEAGWPDSWRAETLEMLRSFLWSEARLTDLYDGACQMITARVDPRATSESE
ncbi:hypothetical protein H2204_007182 [Knufia peltigerae]|uniref:Uncharacterized protein n=1 Tax=Knufia peltigerae TaxID=1002370 RepID=A0AA38Y2B2_9EURO|nr:hypothetical protein H2204_007182 [Knufia peltigerae]